jgi:hypothetical protein
MFRQMLWFYDLLQLTYDTDTETQICTIEANVKHDDFLLFRAEYSFIM